MPIYEITDQTTHSLIEQKEGVDTVSVWIIPKIGTAFSVRYGMLSITVAEEELVIPRSLITVPTSSSDIDLAQQIAFLSQFTGGGGGGNTNWLGALAAPPSLTGTAGDWFTSTATGENVYWDSVLSKWLSVATYSVGFARTGDVLNNTPLQCGSVVMSTAGAARGIIAGFDATIFGLVCNRSNSDFVATLDVYKNNNIGSPIAQATFTPDTQLYVSASMNVDVLANDVIGIRVTGGVTAKVSFPIGQLLLKRKY